MPTAVVTERSDSWKQKAPARGGRKPRISRSVRQSRPRGAQGRREQVCTRGRGETNGDPRWGQSPGTRRPRGRVHVALLTPVPGLALPSLPSLHRPSRSGPRGSPICHGARSLSRCAARRAQGEKRRSPHRTEEARGTPVPSEQQWPFLLV